MVSIAIGSTSVAVTRTIFKKIGIVVTSDFLDSTIGFLHSLQEVLYAQPFQMCYWLSILKVQNMMVKH